VETFVVVKKPGEAAVLVEAPPKLDLEFLKVHIGGYIEVFPKRGYISETLDAVTIFMDEEGALSGLPDNVAFPIATVVGPILACLTDEEGDDHGLCREHAEAVARALDHYAVGPKQPN